MAQRGAGQTIYIVNAKHDPNIGPSWPRFNSSPVRPSRSNRHPSTATTAPAADGGQQQQ